MNKSSFFTTIEDEATLSGLRIQNIFTGVANNIKSIFDKTTRINFGGGFEAQFQSDVIAIENYINQLNAGRSAEEAFAATMRSASIEAQNFANSLNATTYSEEQAAEVLANFSNQQSMSQISMMAQNRSLSNVRMLLNEYNSGMATCGLTQQQFTQSIGQSNSTLANYLGTVGVGDATMKGYIGSLIAAKIASIGLRIATTALNAVIGMGIGLIVSLITSGITQLIEYIKDNTKPIAEQLEDINSELKETESSIKEISDNFKQLKSNANDVIPRFTELAKGVDSFRENVSLTDEEYAEFLELNNKIANMFPELNMGMDDNGNAMLALSYSADTLTESLNALVEAQREAANQELADKLPDLVDDTKTKRELLNKEIEGYKSEIENYQQWTKDLSSGKVTTDWYSHQGADEDKYGNSDEVEYAKMLKQAGVKYHVEEEEREGVGNPVWDFLEVATGNLDWQKRYTFVLDDSQEAFERAMDDYVAGLNNKINNVKQQINKTWQSMNPSLQAWLKTNSTFDSFSENLQNIATTMLKNVDWSNLGLETDEEITGYIERHILDPLSQADLKTQAAFDELVKIEPSQFDSVSNYMDAIESKINEIANMSETDGLDYDSIFNGLGYDEIFKKYNEAIDGIKNLLPEVSESMIKSLAPDKVVECFSYIKTYGIQSWDDLQTFIKAKNFSDSFNPEDIEVLKDELDDLKDTWDDISGVIDDYNKNGYYTIDNLKSLLELEPEYLNALIDENGQINLNSQAYREYISTKAKTLVIDQVKSLYETVLNMGLEEAQAYANAEAFETEAKSLGDLISATTQYYLILAKAKDSQSNTTAYTDALRQSFGTVANYAAVYDSWLNSLSTSTNEFSTATNEATSALESQKSALEDEKDALEDYKDGLENAKDALEDYKDALENAQDDLQSLIELTTDYIKQLKEDEKDALEEQKDNFDEIIEKRKEALELAKEEREEADKLADKQKAVVKDKLALAIAQLDDSSAGKKAQKQAADNLVSSNKDLTDYLYEQEYNTRIAALEAEQEAFDNSIDEQIDKIDEYLNNARQLYEDACNMIDNDTGALYGNLWNYTYNYTTQTRAEFDNLWSNAQLAIQRYRGDNESLLSVMENIQLKIYDTDTQIDNLNTQIDNCETQISELDTAISNTSDAIDDTSSAIDNVSSSLDGLGSSISNYIDQLNRLANTTVGDNTNKTSFWVNYNGKKYETGSHYNGDTKGNRLLAANELTKLIAKDVSGFDNYGLSQIQAMLGVGTNSKVHGWYYQFDGKTYTSTSQSKDNAVKQIRQQLASKYGNSSFVLDQVYSKIQKYAEGTKAAHGGLSIVDEEGLFSEFIPYQIGKGRYSFLPEGNPVFSKAMTNTLFDFASDPAKYANSIINNSTRKSGDTTFSSAPVYHIYGNIDDSTLQRIDKQEKKRYELFKKQFMLEMLRENKNL